ncbi:uncharacterized protein G2W53_010015 [Senna tora]|uniref:Uncharacterized protein n=1 Tax=Senna tora TaxID=362788 RepID=A0A835CAU9_9FABA|nr:uncharacterized protein G2W53_010015 [Senna tora]
MRQKTRCATESNTSVRVVLANRSGFEATIGVFLASEERGSCLNIFRTTNRGRISETFTNYEAKDSLQKQKTCCASESNTSVRVVLANRSGFDAPIGVVLAWEERGSPLNIFKTTNRGRISETFTNNEAKHLLRKSVDHALTYSGRKIAVGSQKPSRITRQNTCCASESNTSVRVVLANRSGFDALIASWHGRSVDHLSTYSGRQIAVRSQKPSRITRQKTCCATESYTSVRVVLANRSGFDAPIGVVSAWEERGSCLNIFRTTNRVVLAWEERGSCLNMFRTTNRGRISETFTNYEAKDLLRKNLHELRRKRLVAQVSETRRLPLYLRTGVVLMLQFESSWQGTSVDHVLTYFGRQIAVGSQKPSRITRQKTCCASEPNTSVLVVLANRSGFDAPIGVVLAWEERGSCLNKFQTTNRGRISETFTNYEAKDLLRKSVDHLLTYSGRQIAVGSQKPSRITRQNTCCASESNTSVRVVLANRSGFDAPIGIVLAWEERGSYLNIFWTQITVRVVVANRSGFDALIASWHGRSVDHLLTYSGRKIAVGSQKPSRITRQNTCCASESNTSVRVVLANRSGFDALIASWHGRSVDHLLTYSGDKSRSDLINLHELRGKRLVAQVSQTRRFALYLRTIVVLMLQLESSWHGRSVDHVSTYSGRQITVGSHKPSRITRQKTCSASESNRSKPSRITRQKACCASESNTSVRVVLANRSGFDAPIGVVLAWEERGSCLNKFQTTNRSRISETFTNYEAKDLLRK